MIINKNIMAAFVALVSTAAAKPYVGVKIGLSQEKSGGLLNNIMDTDDGLVASIKGIHPILASSKKNAPLIGLVFGYSFKENSCFSPYVEADYEYKNLNLKSSRIDVILNNDFNSLQNDHIDIKNSHAIGLTLGSTAKITDKVSGLFGMRFNASFYNVSAYHISSDGTTKPENKTTKRTCILGIEPIAGVQYKMSDKVSGRLTIGYNIQQSKQVVNNYMNHSAAVTNGFTAGAKIAPSSVNIRASLIYTF